MVKLSDKKARRMLNVLSKLAERFPPEVVDAILEGDEELLAAMVIAAKGASRFAFVHGLFTDPVAQIEKVREWNKELGWGFTDGDFVEAEKSIPAWPKKELVAVVLVPYLAGKPNDNGTVMTGLERTFHELWALAKCERYTNYRRDGCDKAGADSLRSLEGDEYPRSSAGQASPILRWEIIDFGCSHNENLTDGDSEKSPYTGTLAAAALHPRWVERMDGDKVPYVWLPGYEVQISRKKPRTIVLYPNFYRVNREHEPDYEMLADRLMRLIGPRGTGRQTPSVDLNERA